MPTRDAPPNEAPAKAGASGDDSLDDNDDNRAPSPTAVYPGSFWGDLDRCSV